MITYLIEILCTCSQHTNHTFIHNMKVGVDDTKCSFSENFLSSNFDGPWIFLSKKTQSFASDPNFVTKKQKVWL